jgi:hypothetical protein
MAKNWFGKWKENQPICLPFYQLFILCHKASPFQNGKTGFALFLPFNIETKHCGFPDPQYG